MWSWVLFDTSAKRTTATEIGPSCDATGHVGNAYRLFCVTWQLRAQSRSPSPATKGGTAARPDIQ